MNNTVLRSFVFGTLFGACFPLGAWTFDYIISEHDFTLSNIAVIHSNNLLHWIIDLAPFVLGMMGYIIGVHRRRLELYAQGLEQKVIHRTQDLQAKQAKIEIHERELDEFLNSAPVMMWMTDPNGHLVKFNHAVSVFRGKYFEQDQTEKWSGKGVHADDLSRWKKTYRTSYTEHTPFNHEFRWQSNDDEYRWISEVSYPRFNLDNQYIGHTGVCLDITERKKSEQAILLLNKELKFEKDNAEKATRKAEHANEAKSQFLSNMSHELRTPLNAIIGFAQLLESDKEEPLSAEQQENIAYVLTGGQHLLGLINNVLELTAIEAGETTLSIEPLSLTKVMNESLTLLKTLASKNNIQIHVLSDLAYTVNADYIRFKQIIINLVSNAIKYNREEGSVNIDWKRKKDNTIRINITDTGIGISEANKHRVFGAFNRLGQEKSVIEGTGIGLVLTKDLVEIMDGQIGFESVENEGSTFWFELPLVVKSA